MKRALIKIKESLTNNVGIKISAVMIAAIVWLAVININDPEKTKVIYNIPVTVTNEEVITDMSMVYNLESKNTVNITVSGKRSIVSSLSAEDFVATASLKELSKVNAVPVEVSAKKNSISGKITVVKQSVQTVTVNVEEIGKQEFDIEVEFNGKVADGYVIGTYSLSRNTVNVKAPMSVLDRITRVVANCNLDKSDADISQRCKLLLYDKHGKEIKADNVRMSVGKVDVSVNILKEKEIPIRVNSVGNPASGYEVAGMKLSKENIKVVGTKEALSDLDILEVNGSIDITNQTGDVTANIDLKGEKKVMKEITKSQLNASIDLKGYDKGTVTVPVSITIPEGTELVKAVNVKVKMK